MPPFGPIKDRDLSIMIRRDVRAGLHCKHRERLTDLRHAAP